MNSRKRTIHPHTLNKRFRSKFPEGYLQQTHEDTKDQNVVTIIKKIGVLV